MSCDGEDLASADYIRVRVTYNLTNNDTTTVMHGAKGGSSSEIQLSGMIVTTYLYSSRLTTFTLI